ncbi:hypothetical protein FB45DRAFT_1023077 [Roridomyces roridus]|uniref:Uncharacterized protein n=1 Tax=Roridomyces roridus TaxID=1738132 RepID=A0AAD7C3V5_9AGAR|nr:hypothetical protein FB45DRAFT_1023077 [Roridomyces roridus]
MDYPHSDSTLAPDLRLFVSWVRALQSGSRAYDELTDILSAWMVYETHLRVCYATEPNNPSVANLYAGLLVVFLLDTAFRRIYGRPHDIRRLHLFPLPATRRLQDGTPSIVHSIDQFRNNFRLFTHGVLAHMDWTNVFAAGGSITACLRTRHVSPEDIGAGRWLPGSDVDLFVWGMTALEAQLKITHIYLALNRALPDTLIACVRTKYTVSFYLPYPMRTVQVVLRLYDSPGQVLAGFDIDAVCAGFDGNEVLASPRAIVSWVRQANTIDVTRRSPTYETRLVKYAGREFEIFVPGLRRDDIHPDVWGARLSNLRGLALLLRLESRWANRLAAGRNVDPTDLLFPQDHDDLGPIRDYDVPYLWIPIGPGWPPQRIITLVNRVNADMNTAEKLAIHGVHRHVAFAHQSVLAVLDPEGLCVDCPAAVTPEQVRLHQTFMRGRVTFIQGNAGQQLFHGSFNPTTVGDWTEQAYNGTTLANVPAPDVAFLEEALQLVDEGPVALALDLNGTVPFRAFALGLQAHFLAWLFQLLAIFTAQRA